MLLRCQGSIAEARCCTAELKARIESAVTHGTGPLIILWFAAKHKASTHLWVVIRVCGWRLLECLRLLLHAPLLLLPLSPYPSSCTTVAVKERWVIPDNRLIGFREESVVECKFQVVHIEALNETLQRRQRLRLPRLSRWCCGRPRRGLLYGLRCGFGLFRYRRRGRVAQCWTLLRSTR